MYDSTVIFPTRYAAPKLKKYAREAIEALHEKMILIFNGHFLTNMVNLVCLYSQLC